MTDLRFPVGRFDPRAEITPGRREAWIGEIAALPVRLREAVAGLSEERLDTPYREGGWTVRQVIHHLPDSHMNGYVRAKLSLTEEAPLIKTYDEARWAELADTRDTPPEVSLALLDALHARWAVLYRSLDEAQWKRTFTHPELGAMTLERHLSLYAWHGRHHTAHVTSLRERMGW
ncbi:MAG TPA: bacillithiol transferase BstA [Longimicrobium sp.]|nr:bacillithiol transferase BstA [Longimicrobium sp.]